MERMQFSIHIHADKATIWKVLWDDATYRTWTSVFFEGSHAVSDNWKEGSQVQFLSPDGNGMYSIIEKHIPNEFMSFKHIGVVKNGLSQPIDEETRKWSGAMEQYRLTDSGNGCVLDIQSDTQEEFTDFMQKTFPMALEKIKMLSENPENK